MAPLPVISNVVRVDIGWNTVGGVAPHNTFHVITASGDLEQIGLDLGAAFDAGTPNCFASLSSSYSTDEVLVTPLDGSTAGQNVPLGTTIAGGTSGQLLPAVSALVSFRTNQRGPQGRGRLYIGPITESSVDGGTLDSGDVNNLRTSWINFAAELPTTTSNMSLAVASYTHSEVYGVQTIQVPSLVATQRRRQDQLR